MAREKNSQKTTDGVLIMTGEQLAQIKEIIVNPIINSISDLKKDIEKLYEAYSEIKTLDKTMTELRYQTLQHQTDTEKEVQALKDWRTTHCFGNMPEVRSDISQLIKWKKEYEESKDPENQKKRASLP